MPKLRVRIVRFLFICLSLIAVAAILLVAAAFSPWVQTWVVEKLLARQPGIQASVGSVSVGLGAVNVSNLRLSYEGAVLTVPSADIALPVKTAVWNRKIEARRLVAKGWTLDLTHRLVPETKPVTQSAGERTQIGRAQV